MHAPSILSQSQWRVIDQTTLGPSFEAKQSFAIDDALCDSVGQGHSSPVARTWVHHDTVILGIQDTRLPHLQNGLNYLEEQKCHYIVRNSGGLAVPLDEGVLNISLIFPEAENGISINTGYEAMTDFIKKMLVPYHLNIEAREIATSYCPGSYDLSVNGRKFAGISQRRLRHGVAVQVYLCIDGTGAGRARLIKDFYERALQGEQTKFAYPHIVPENMVSLAEITGEDLDVSKVMALFYMTLRELGQITPSQLNLEEVQSLSNYYDRMVKRNEKVFG
ncbi:lipoate--protein ligase family protein [Tuberibacillus sp. Marseille-P3662]|uniref:lipoate--protein ligase family protein n=1 Tax=Tuberibacillus sp. Marseille-P3662 TaxID=1965358 RepID=UPI000A1CD48B|nr:lipoate--protein ligase family protein [Tuberibacillus sp. Marseille-P3662]